MDVDDKGSNRRQLDGSGPHSYFGAVNLKSFPVAYVGAWGVDR